MKAGKMTNNVATWLWLIGTKENAVKLRTRLPGLKSPPLDPGFGPEPVQCPLTVLYGAEVSRQAYANADIRSALDAWDTGEVSPDDLRRWCLVIEKGEYATDCPFDPWANAIIVKARQWAVAKQLADRVNSRERVGPERKGTLDRRKREKKQRKTYSPINWNKLDL